MPKQFEKCRKNPKSKIRTITGPSKRWGVPAGKYRRICSLPNGSTSKGYLKTPKTKKKKKPSKGKKYT